MESSIHARTSPQPRPDMLRDRLLQSIQRLSRCAKVLDGAETGAIGGVEVHRQGGEQCLGRLQQAVEIVPPAMARQLLFQVAPEALDQIELRRIGGQEEGFQTVGVAPPPRTQRMTLVVTDVVQHDDDRFVGRQRLCQIVKKRAESRFTLPRVRLPEHLAGRVVDGAKDDRFPVLARRRNLQWLPFALPDLCQVRVGVEFALVHVDQMESCGLNSCFFGSHSSTCWAAATAS